MMNSNVQKNIYPKLFIETFMLSAFTFGGGFVIISLMKKRFVDELKWITNDEMMDLTAIAQSCPGPVAVNASIILGYKIAGIWGAVTTILGTITPPLFILSIVFYFYNFFKDNLILSSIMRAMQAGVAAVITDVTVNLGTGVLREKRIIYDIVMVIAFIATYFLKINVIFIVIISAVIGGLQTVVKNKSN